MDLADLCTNKVVEPSPGALQAATLIDSWAAHVLRFLARPQLPWTDQNHRWTLDYLVAAAYIRDRLQLGLDGNPPPPSIPAIDTLFRSFTVEDEDQALGLVGYEIPAAPWWWQ